MDELDKKLFHDLSSETEIPNKYKNTVRQTINELAHKKNKHISFIKLAVTSCATLLMTTGIVYAGTKVYEQIFKEPEKIVGFYSEGSESGVVTAKGENIMSKTEAEEKLNEILSKFGHTNYKIKEMKLYSNPNSYDLIWHIELDNGTKNNSIVEINAEREEAITVLFEEELNNSVINYRTTESEVEKTARELCKDYGYDTEKYNKVNIMSNMEKAENSYLWHVDFYKEYDGIINPYETISISFIPEINKIYQFRIENIEYENNSVEITEEQAKQTVEESEQKINTGHNIKNISVDLDIAKTNGDAYKRVTNYQEYYNEIHLDNYPVENEINYRTESRVRKVWKVTVEYDIERELELNDETTNAFDRYYEYYIDSTTGEIIGGRIPNY